MVNYEPDQYPNRPAMVQDILESKRFDGWKYETVIDSLGTPEQNTSAKENELWYPIVVDYGSNIDPVYTKHLVLTLNSDSTITGVETKERNTTDDY